MKTVIWILSAKKDLMRFPKPIQKAFGYGLYRAQQGEYPNGAKALTGFSSAQIIEMKEDDRSGTYRAIYTVKFQKAIIVLHVFQKKSTIKTKTPQKEIDLVHIRLRRAKEIYEEWRKQQK